MEQSSETHPVSGRGSPRALTATNGTRSIPWVLFVLGAFILGALLGYYLGTQKVGSGLIPEGERTPVPPLEETK